MERLYADDALCAELGGNARQRYESLFTADAMGRDYYKVYERIHEEFGGGRPT